ncbi:MAG: amylo-alpha-1,6-glucosidase, partial [Candidatus Bathyarchaeia archaeon]
MKVPIINLSREVLCCFEDSIRREWIITNGLGGYASSTVLGINTRKYHGLLVAAFHPPADRRVCLEKLDEEVEIKSNIYPLGANDYQNDIFPKGHQFLTEVTVSPFPRYVYTVQNVEIEKTVFMPREKNAVVTLYKVQNKNNLNIRMRVFPLVNWRHFHSVTSRWKISAEPIQQSEKNETRITLSEPKFALILRIIDGKYCQEGKWVEKIYYREEARRGESCLDDAYQPGFFEVAVEANRKEAFAVAAAAHENQETAQNTIDTMPANIYDMEGLYEKEMARHENFLTHFYETHSKLNASPWLSLIAIATDMFIVKAKNPEYNSVIAGYHWFESWGRDAFISLPGLALVTGKFENARKIFLNFKNHYKAGLIPNIIADSAQETLIYNSVDATLWFLHALLQYLKYTGDYKFVQDHLWNTLKDIVDSHMKGTDFNIHVDSDGLLSHGPQLTWMDTVVDDKPVTPRSGKAVEIQALWFNSLKIMELLAKKFKEAGKAEEYARMAEKAKKSFTENFWNEEKNCLYDAVSENEKDST